MRVSFVIVSLPSLLLDQTMNVLFVIEPGVLRRLSELAL